MDQVDLTQYIRTVSEFVLCRPHQLNEVGCAGIVADDLLRATYLYRLVERLAISIIMLCRNLLVVFIGLIYLLQELVRFL